MTLISIEKVTVNIGVGGAGEKLEKAKKLISKLTGRQPVETLCTQRIPSWNIRKGMAIGAKVTLRGEEATGFLNKCLDATARKVPAKAFDSTGNFSFGIKEYIDVPGFRYDPEIGMFGFDVCVTLGKWGYRMKKRKRASAHVPAKHLIKREDAIAFARDKLKIEVLE
jgi:large subunit ribosomal protein L5